jgi:uncharacterized repeat protein (TIGR03803 family)
LGKLTKRFLNNNVDICRFWLIIPGSSMFSTRYLGVLLLGCATVSPVESRAGSFVVLHDFAGGADGSYPSAALTPFGGALFGTTTGGNSAENPASIFRVDPATGSVTNFSQAYGSIFFGSLLPVGSLLYGTAENTPTAGYGSVFSFDPATAALTPIYAFKSGADGAFPLGSLAQNEGLLYGATVGGSNFHGTLFSVDPVTGHERVLHRFEGTDGDQPSAGVTYAFGALFGTTSQGGANGQGEVFRFDLATNEFKVLHSFSGGADGGSPVYSGVTALNGVLYGVTRLGGAAGHGAVYRMDPYNGAETVIYSFTGGADGDSPLCNLVVTSNAAFGTTEFGGKNGLGTVFRVDTATGAITILHSFAPATSAPEYGPNAGLALYAGGLFGVTTYNGLADVGTVFELKP